MTSKSSFILTTAMLVVSTLIIAITVPEQAEAARAKVYCVLGFGPDNLTFFQCFQTKKECEEGLKIAEQDFPDFVFALDSCSNKLSKALS